MPDNKISIEEALLDHINDPEIIVKIDKLIDTRVDEVMKIKCVDCRDKLQIQTKHENWILGALVVTTVLLCGFCAFLYYYSLIVTKVIDPKIWKITEYVIYIVGIAWVLGILRIRPADVWSAISRGTNYLRSNGR